MKQTTLCFLLKDNTVLLAMKKRGFGIGKWNGVGGKVKDGEAIRESAVRETAEEIGVQVVELDLKDAGILEFSFKDNPGWNNLCHIFITERWVGDPSESEEVKPAWYSCRELPFASMWVDDPHWLPMVLAGKKVSGKFLFDKTGTALIDFSVAIIA